MIPRKKITPSSPKKPVNEPEKSRINAAYMNITTSSEKFVPVKGVTYLWIYKPPEKPDDEKEIIIGIERPWEYPQAFGMKASDEKWKILAKQLQEADELGHVTLAATFDSKGAAQPELSKAYIGGELRYKSDGHWQMDNSSGRFGDLKGISLEQVRELVNEAAIHFEKATGIQPKVYVRPPKTDDYKRYKGIWKTDTKGKDDIEKAIKLLRDYIGDEKKSVTGAESKHYTSIVTEALQTFENKKPKDIKEFLDFFSSKLGKPKHINDPLITGLMFIARKTKSEFELSDVYVASNLGKSRSS